MKTNNYVKFSLNSEHKVKLISIQPGDEESKPGHLSC